MNELQVNEKLSFLGQEIYVGIDVHKKQWNVFIMSKLKEHKGYRGLAADDEFLDEVCR